MEVTSVMATLNLEGDTGNDSRVVTMSSSIVATLVESGVIIYRGLAINRATKHTHIQLWSQGIITQEASRLK